MSADAKSLTTRRCSSAAQKIPERANISRATCARVRQGPLVIEDSRPKGLM